MAHLEHQHFLFPAVFELERGDLRIGRLLVVVEQIVPAHRADLRGVFHAEGEARRVDLVGALIADVAVAVIPLPVPVVVEAIAREWPGRRRAGPQIVGDAGRRRFFLGTADCVAPLEDETARHVDVADDPFSDLLPRFMSQPCAPVPSCTIRLYFRAAATIWRASNMLYETGFSTRTSLPAWTAQIVCSVW